jgi:hypothetical protein
VTRRRVLSTDLFPVAPRLTRPESVRTAAVVAGLVVVSVLALVLWRPWPYAADLVWAEDGLVFLTLGVQRDLSEVLLVPYNGYTHVVPWLLVELVTLLPTTWWALGLGVVAATVRALLGAMAWYALAGHVPSRTARALIAAVLLTAPLGNFETLNTLANVHWFLVPAAVPALLWTPARWGGTVVQTLVVAGAVLSDPVTCLLAPVVLLRMLTVRSWRHQVVSIVFVLASALQTWTVLNAERESSVGMGYGDIVRTYLVRVVLATFGGKGGTEAAFNRLGWWAVAAAVAVSALVLVLGLRRPGPHRTVVLVCLGASAVFWVAATRFGIGTDALLPVPPISMVVGARYSIPAMIVLAMALVAAGAGALRAAAGPARRLLGAGAAALVAVYAVGVVLTTGAPTSPVAQPWRAQVDAACTSPAEEVATLDITPGGWVVAVPCTVIRADRG